jgi:hypothetical protein
MNSIARILLMRLIAWGEKAGKKEEKKEEKNKWTDGC